MKRVILIVLSLTILLMFGGCAVSDSTSMPSSTSANNLPTETRVPTFEEAVARAQESTEVQEAIAEEIGLLYYSIEWGYPEKMYRGATWYEINLYGNISGYKDRYKTMYVNKNAFKVNLQVFDDGRIRVCGVRDKG